MIGCLEEEDNMAFCRSVMSDTVMAVNSFILDYYNCVYYLSA